MAFGATKNVGKIFPVGERGFVPIIALDDTSFEFDHLLVEFSEHLMARWLPPAPERH